MGVSWRIYIQGFILEAYSDDDLNEFCEERHKFKEAVHEFHSSMKTKARVLIQFCDKRGLLFELRDELKKHRGQKWQEYEKKHDPVEDETSRSGLSEARELASDYKELFDKVQETPKAQNQSSTQDAQPTEHPLSGSAEDIYKWFSNDLNDEERVFATTAVLLNGIERQEFTKIYKNVLSLMLKDNKDGSTL